jgi:isopenicillin-N epimerase
MREYFLLDEDVVFLNHGSFGACPVPVFDVYQQWQRELERQPVEFLGRRFDALMDEARAKLAVYLCSDSENVVFVPNATVGINTVARSLDLQAGDEVLTTDHEYGAIDYTWQYVCEQAGARLVRQPVPIPLTNADTAIEHLWNGVTPRTKVIAVSHITSPTALIFPAAEICRRAREAGILTVVDGAHAPGQIPVDLEAIGADFYSGNCHKWMCAPKGAGFLYVRPEHHSQIVPLVISWGWLPDSTLVSRSQWQGTRDIAAYLSVPATIDFLETHDWPNVQAACHALAVEARRRIHVLTGLPEITPETMVAQMFTVPIPTDDILRLKTHLYDVFRVEVPAIEWKNQPMLRISVQAYNTQHDIDVLLDALAATFDQGYTG